MPINDPMTSPSDVPWSQSVVSPRYSRLSFEEQLQLARRPQRFVTGDALNGWNITDDAPVYTGQSFGGQHFLRSQLNDLENPRGIFGDNPQNKTELMDLIDQQRGSFNAWKNTPDILSTFIPFVDNSADELGPILTREEPGWNGGEEWKAFEKQNPEVAQFLVQARGFDPDSMHGTRNRDAFMLAINLEMTKAKLQQEIDEYERSAGTVEGWTQFIAGGAVRQLLLDSDATKSLGLAGAGKLVGIGAKAAQATGKATKLLTTIEKATRVGQVHNVLSQKLRLGTLGALVTEGAATGAAWDIQHQLGMQDIAQMISQSDLEFDYSDTFKAAGIGALFGLGIYGGIRAMGGAIEPIGRKAAAVKKTMDVAGIGDTALARHGMTPEGLTMQALEEDVFVKVNRVLSEATDERLGFVLSRESVEASGRTMPEVGEFMARIENLKKRGIRISDEAVLGAVDDFLNQGALKELSPTERLAVEKQWAREKALEMKQKDPQWRAAQTASLDQWKSAQNRLKLLKSDSDLSIEDAMAVLDGTGIKSLKTKPTYQQLSDTIFNEIAIRENLLNNPADPSSVIQLAESGRTVGGFSPTTVAGRLIQDLNAQFAIIDEQRAIGGKTSGNAVKAAKEEIRRLTATLRAEYGQPKRRMKSKTKLTKPAKISTKTLDKLPVEEQNKILDEMFERIEQSPNDVLESTNIINRALKASGYEGPLKSWLLDRTGINSTARSKNKLAREVAALFFGSPELNSRQHAGRGGAGVSLWAARGRGLRDVNPAMSFLERFRNRPGVTEEVFQDFNDTVRSALNKKEKMPASHAFAKEGNELIDVWTKITEQHALQGKRNGSLNPSKEAKKSVILPLVANENFLMRNYESAVTDLISAWQRKAKDSSFLNPTYLEALGWVDRPVDQYGRRVGKAIAKVGSPLEGIELVKSVKKTDLTPEALADYNKALDNPEILRKTAENYWSRQLAQDVRDSSPRAITDRVHGSNSRAAHQRKITQQMLEEFPELKKYFENDLFTLFDTYGKTVGFKVHAGDSIHRAFGVRGTVGQVMNYLEAKMEGLAKGVEKKEVVKTFDKLHEMIAWMNGYLPDLDPSYSKWATTSVDTMQSTGFAMVAGGMGLSNAAEAVTKMFYMIHEPADFARNVKSLTRALFSKQVQREELAGLAHDYKRLAVGYSHQLSVGRMDHAFELTTTRTLTRPWKDAMDTVTGKIDRPGAPNRFMGSVNATIDAVGKTAYVLGGSPRITHATQVLIAGATQREFFRFADATMNLRRLMEQTPITPGDHKAFKQMARSAGFGGDWHIAEKMIRWDLMEPGVVESLQAAAQKVPGVSNKQHVRIDQLMKVYAEMPAGAEKASLYEATQRYAQYVDDMISESLGEASPFSARTDARSRTGIGRALDMMTHYMHNTYFHKFGKSASVPARAFLGTITGLATAELVVSLIQRYLNGETVEEINKNWDTPEEALGSLLSASLRVPIFGNQAFIPKFIADTGISHLNTSMGNDPLNAFAPSFGGVVGGGMDTLFRMGKGSARWAFDLDPEQSDKGRSMALNASMKFLPAINSAYGKLAVRQFTDLKSRQSYNQQREFQPQGDGRSIWGDEDLIVPEGNPEQTVSEPTFDLEAVLTGKKK